MSLAIPFPKIIATNIPTLLYGGVLAVFKNARTCDKVEMYKVIQEPDGSMTYEPVQVVHACCDEKAALIMSIGIPSSGRYTAANCVTRELDSSSSVTITKPGSGATLLVIEKTRGIGYLKAKAGSWSDYRSVCSLPAPLTRFAVIIPSEGNVESVKIVNHFDTMKLTQCDINVYTDDFNSKAIDVYTVIRDSYNAINDLSLLRLLVIEIELEQQ